MLSHFNFEYYFYFLTFYAEHSCNPLFLTTESNKRLQKNRNFPENPQIPQYES